MLGEWTEPGHQILKLLRMARREQHWMAGLNPQPANRATDMARADDADAQFAATCLREDRQRPQRCEKGQCAACAEQRTARVVKTLLLPHLELLATRFSLYIHLLGSQRPSHHGCVKCNSPCDGRIDRRWPIWPVPGERSIWAARQISGAPIAPLRRQRYPKRASEWAAMICELRSRDANHIPPTWLSCS